MKIGFRTIKTAFGVFISIFIAQFFELSYFTSTGVLTLLCIQKTRKQSHKAISERFFACMIGVIFASLLFTIIGYAPFSFLILFLFFIPICVKLNIHGGIPSSCVIIMHVYINQHVNFEFFMNELFIIIIGVGVAFLVNYYMPSSNVQLIKYKTEIDDYISKILIEFSIYLKKGDTNWDGKELLTLTDHLIDARNLAVLDIENNLTRKENPFYYYFEIKHRQLQILERILPIISRINLQLEQSTRLGDFIEQLSSNLNNHDHTNDFLNHLKSIREYHKLLPLPETRIEFENRANLYNLANELERFVTMIYRSSDFDE